MRALVALALASGPVSMAAPGNPSLPVGMATSADTTCVLDRDAVVWCWGGDVFGELGDGDPSEARVEAEPILTLDSVGAIGTGVYHVCAVELDGDVKCWGRNGSGQLGDGTVTSRTQPVAMPITDGVAVVGGHHHTCVLRRTGAVACVGRNQVYQLGRDGGGSLPADVPGLADVVSLSAGSNFTCVLLRDSSVWCWGGNEFGQTGGDEGDLGCFQDRWPCTPRPRRVLDLPAAVSITAGGVHACAVTTVSEMWCWGENMSGQLNQPFEPYLQQSSKPLRVPIADVVAADAGGRFTCAVRADGSTWCWGSNASGQHGNGMCCLTHRVQGRLPTILPQGASAISASPGAHTCAIATDDDLYCWGYNGAWQLGYRSDPLLWWPIPRPAPGSE